MRVMVIVKANKDSEAGVLPSTEILTKMGKYNEQLVQAGVMLSGNNRVVTDGPFAETKELIAGFWLWRVNSMQDAVEWLKQAPFDGGEEVEIRQIFEASDFGDNFTPELREQERHLSEQIAAKK